VAVLFSAASISFSQSVCTQAARKGAFLPDKYQFPGAWFAAYFALGCAFQFRCETRQRTKGNGF
jgi:hypothetical protein